MGKRMLIDATHAEETRVVVLNGNRLEEFDVETSTKKQLKGNIYLAKVVRVEPSLQAAFVEYGGNRHGFLAFSEIHPDYYQIPVADRQALLAEHREAIKRSASSGGSDFDDDDAPADRPAEAAAEAPMAEAETPEPTETDAPQSEDAPERPKRRSLRNYKIQEVIKRRQILLIQVVKEERGNKGAALTTFLSLAGRYCVLMPNTARGGGVSRKITNVVDRKRLKAIVGEMDIPEGMAVIVRTAGSERTKPEIKRDYEYLLRLWDSVRELTLKSTAPALVYEEANLIKRSIRDLYSRDIDEILVDGDDGYRLAKDFMRMLMPSHARRVQLFREPAMSLFHKFQVDTQLDAMMSPVVQLKSGGYLVINQTEALVAIDVNSGSSTKERHIEETALKTNSEAADEVARQLRLRDLAGLIVIDFIDMEEMRNNHAVERRLKDAMRFDRARIQLGKISSFGLMELSRQRLRPSLIENSFQPCPHCNGTGMIRSVESASMHVLRAIEDEGSKCRSSEITVTVHPSIALYILNQKRADLSLIETRFAFKVFLAGNDSLIPPAFQMERVKAETPIIIPAAARPISAGASSVEDDVPEDHEEEEIAAAAPPPPADEERENGENGNGNHRRRRRGRGRGHASEDVERNAEQAQPSAEPEEAETAAEETENGDEPETAIVVADGSPAPRRRRRGKRGGRRRNRGNAPLQPMTEEDGTATLPAGDASDDQAVTSLEPALIMDVPAIDVGQGEEITTQPEIIAQSAPAPLMDEPRSEPAPEPLPARTEPVEVPATAESGAEPAVAESAPEPEAAPAKKPRKPRAPRKKAEPAQDEAVSEPVKAPAKKAAAPKKPAAKKAAPKRTKKAVAAETPELAESPVPETTPVTTPIDAVPEAAAAVANSNTPQTASPADAPQDAAQEKAGVVAETDQPKTPRRTGWWNRPA